MGSLVRLRAREGPAYLTGFSERKNPGIARSASSGDVSEAESSTPSYYTDAVVTCADGVRLRASTVTLAAISPLMKTTLLSSMSGPCNCATSEDTIEIHAQAKSDHVLAVLHFMQTGCFYSPVGQASQLTRDLVESFLTFGIDLEGLQLVPDTGTVAGGPPEMSAYKAKPPPPPPPAKNGIKEDHDFKPAATVQVKTELKTDDDFYDDYYGGVDPAVDPGFEPPMELDWGPEDEDEEDDWKPKTKKGAKRKLGRPKGSGTGGAAKRRRVRRNSDGTGQQPGVQRNRYDVMQIQKEALFYFPQQGDIDRTRPFECDRCVRVFSLAFDLRQHLLRHDRESNKEVLTCLNCLDTVGRKVSFETEAKYIEHVKVCTPSFKKIHSDEKKSCYFHFPESREKDISYPFKCRLCIRAFKSLPSLEQHLRRHEGLVTESLPFGCLKCNKAAFKTASQQEKHQVACSNEAEELSMRLQELYKQHNIRSMAQKKKEDMRGHHNLNQKLEEKNLWGLSYDETKSQVKKVKKPASERNVTAKGIKCLGWESIKDKYRTESLQKYFYYFPQPGETDQTKNFQCSRCVRKFELEDDLLQHERRHDAKSEQEVYFCLKCEDKSFADERDYVDHMRDCDPTWEFKTIKEGVSNNEDQSKYYFHFPLTEEANISFPFKCKLCIRTFRHRKKFEQHLRRHVSSQTIDEAYACLVCNRETFRSWGEWKGHEKQCQGSDEPLPDHIWAVYEQHGLFDPVKVEMASCQPCGKIFNTKSKLVEHLKRMGKYHSLCGSCDYQIKDAGEYQKHISTVHDGVVMQRCSTCGESFSNKFMLAAHRPTGQCPHASANAKSHKGASADDSSGTHTSCICPTCGKELKNQFNLDHHMKTLHGNPKELKVLSLKCPKCPENDMSVVFTTQLDLQAHIRKVHAKTFTCDLCGYSTKRSKSYDIHVLKEHTPNAERPFTCQYCNKGFFEKTLFKDHLNIHTGARPYVCKHCNASFNSQGNYGAHIRQTHKGIKRKK